MPRLDPRRQFAMIIEYFFGRAASRAFPLRHLRYIHSRRSGRLRYIYDGNRLLATIRGDGTVTLTIPAARLLIRRRAFRRYCVVIAPEAEPFVAQGRSVFCKHVEEAGEEIRPADEVVVLNRRGEVIAVGRAVVPGRYMKHFKRGVAVKVRHGAAHGGDVSEPASAAAHRADGDQR